MIKLFYANVYSLKTQHRIAAFSVPNNSSWQLRYPTTFWACESMCWKENTYLTEPNNIFEVRHSAVLTCFSLKDFSNWLNNEISQLETQLPIRQYDVDRLESIQKLVSDFYQNIPLHRYVSDCDYTIRDQILKTPIECLTGEDMIIIK